MQVFCIANSGVGGHIDTYVSRGNLALAAEVLSWENKCGSVPALAIAYRTGIQAPIPL